LSALNFAMFWSTAVFMNTAVDQNIAKFKADNGREPTPTEAAKIKDEVAHYANVRDEVKLGAGPRHVDDGAGDLPATVQRHHTHGIALTEAVPIETSPFTHGRGSGI